MLGLLGIILCATSYVIPWAETATYYVDDSGDSPRPLGTGLEAWRAATSTYDDKGFVVNLGHWYSDSGYLIVPILLAVLVGAALLVRAGWPRWLLFMLSWAAAVWVFDAVYGDGPGPAVLMAGTIACCASIAILATESPRRPAAGGGGEPTQFGGVWPGYPTAAGYPFVPVYPDYEPGYGVQPGSGGYQPGYQYPSPGGYPGTGTGYPSGAPTGYERPDGSSSS